MDKTLRITLADEDVETVRNGENLFISLYENNGVGVARFTIRLDKKRGLLIE